MPNTTQFQGARLIPNLVYHDADEAIIWLDRAFGFTVLLRVEGEGDKIAHAQLVRDEMMIMLSSTRDDDFGKNFDTPQVRGINTQGAYIVVEDVSAAYERALAAGAQTVMPLQTQDYGGEGFTVRDPEGHIWSFGDYDPWV
ncbi:MAG: VOC family protein [Alphaproteobacteria bacterium]|nr:VOC family protein [Alphaproteobacteria bacterium]